MPPPMTCGNGQNWEQNPKARALVEHGLKPDCASQSHRLAYIFLKSRFKSSPGAPIRKELEFN